MKVKKTSKSDLYWYSYDHKGEEWFRAQISLMDFSAIKTTDEFKAAYLQKLLKGAVRLNSEFLSKWNGFDVKTYLEFPRDWGLGSSSTLTYLLAQWADVNPLLLHFEVSEGSGYDVACAGADSPIQYSLQDDTINYSEIDFEPPFIDKLYFVHLNRKASSPAAVEYYFKNVKGRKSLAAKLTEITEQMLGTRSFKSFCESVKAHEELLAENLKMKSVRQELFQDFKGVVKSLGAWGGDFVMACSDESPDNIKSYFRSKGYETVMGFNEMIYFEQDVRKLSEV